MAGTALTTGADAVASDTAAARGGRAFMMWYSFAVDLGAALGPIIVCLLNDVWSMDAAYACTAALLLLFALKWALSAPSARPGPRDSRRARGGPSAETALCEEARRAHRERARTGLPGDLS